MARCEPRVSCINIKKYLKSREISQFGLAPNVRERARERDEGEKKQASPAISRGFASQNSAGRELKLFYATRVMRGYRNHKILPRFKVRVFTENKKRQCPGKSRKLRLGFYPTRFNFYLRACVCVCVKVENAVQFFSSDPMTVFWP